MVSHKHGSGSIFSFRVGSLVGSSHHVGWDCKGKGSMLGRAMDFCKVWGVGLTLAMGFMLGGVHG